MSDRFETYEGVLLYADILGFSDLQRAAFDAGKGDQFLGRFRETLRRVFPPAEPDGDRGALYGATVTLFSDCLVASQRVESGELAKAEPELGRILRGFRYAIAQLACEGFALRGAIAHGPIYHDSEMVCGPPLVEAAAQDKSGRPPGVVLAPTARALLGTHSEFYGNRFDGMPHRSHLFVSEDGAVYLDYLGIAFDRWPDGGVMIDVLQRHRDFLTRNLRKPKTPPSVRSKYQWLADYHDWRITEFLDDNPLPDSHDEDGFLIEPDWSVPDRAEQLDDVRNCLTAEYRRQFRRIESLDSEHG